MSGRSAHFGVAVLSVGIVLVAGALLLTPPSGIAHVIGLVFLGDGLGFMVAGTLIALGRNPLRRR